MLVDLENLLTLHLHCCHVQEETKVAGVLVVD
jgi:hypothetical protein